MFQLYAYHKLTDIINIHINLLTYFYGYIEFKQSNYETKNTVNLAKLRIQVF